MSVKGRHKVDVELTKTKRDQLVVDLVTGATTKYAASKEFGMSDNSIKRWFATVPEDEKLILVAKAKQRTEAAQRRDAAGILMSDGDDIDNDLRWLVKRIRSAIEACTDDDKLLELAQMREMRQQLMDLAKVRGMFSNKIDIAINLADSPQFILLRQIILTVLDQHPDAKADFLLEMQKMQVLEHVSGS